MLARELPDYAKLSYATLSEVTEQWPIVGRGDVYYGGTTYENSQGLGVQLPLVKDQDYSLVWPQIPVVETPILGLIAFPTTRLYDRGTTLLPSDLLHKRIPNPFIVINPDDANRLHIPADAKVQVSLEGKSAVIASVVFSESLPERVVLVPRSFGMPINDPVPVEVKLAR